MFRALRALHQALHKALEVLAAALEEGLGGRRLEPGAPDPWRHGRQGRASARHPLHLAREPVKLAIATPDRKCRGRRGTWKSRDRCKQGQATDGKGFSEAATTFFFFFA